jgi:hypothetical protein
MLRIVALQLIARYRKKATPQGGVQIGANLNEEAFDFGTHVADWIRL